MYKFCKDNKKQLNIKDFEFNCQELIVIQKEERAPEKFFYFLGSKRKTYQHQIQGYFPCV